MGTLGSSLHEDNGNSGKWQLTVSSGILSLDVREPLDEPKTSMEGLWGGRLERSVSKEETLWAGSLKDGGNLDIFVHASCMYNLYV